nr:site-specific DNA-methyltransferase [Deltaproteobacteria bacterium]
PGYRRRDGSLPRGKGVPLDDVWTAGEAELRLRGAQSLDSIQIKSFSTEKTGYATQKNESLLRRIIEASSNPGDTVADVFCGSGTTLRVAESLGRRWIGCDTGRAAVEIATRRMLAGPRRRGVEVCTVAPDERRQWLAQLEETGGSLAEHLQARWSAVAGDDGGPLALRDDDTQTVPSRGEGALAAWRWHVPVPIAEDEAGVLVGEPWPPTGKGAAAARRAPSQWVLQRALFDPRLDGQPAMGLAERARMVVRLRGLRTGSIAVELVALVYPHEDRLPVALPEGPRGALDLVERWSVTWNEQGQRPVDDVLGRFDRARVLPHETPIHRYRGRSARLVVRVDDALHREHRLVCMLTRGTAGWTVEAAHAEAEA